MRLRLSGWWRVRRCWEGGGELEPPSLQSRLSFLSFQSCGGGVEEVVATPAHCQCVSVSQPGHQHHLQLHHHHVLLCSSLAHNDTKHFVNSDILKSVTLFAVKFELKVAETLRLFLKRVLNENVV